MATAAEKRDQLRGLMKGIDIAMFTTWGESGFPVSRPLSTQEVEFDGKALWFFTRRSSAKVEEIRRNPKVNVAYASKERNVYLSVAGTAEAIADITSTGETLRANHLKILSDGLIHRSEATLFKSRRADWAGGLRDTFEVLKGQIGALA